MAELSGQVLAAISNEMVRLKAHLYGKGPVEAKSYLNDNFRFGALKASDHLPRPAERDAGFSTEAGSAGHGPEHR